MKRRLLCLSLIAIAIAPAAATAEPDPIGRCDRSQTWPGPEPQRPDIPRLRTVEIGGEPVNVLLPRGYERRPTRRYPVLYVLHGGGWGETGGPNLWLNETEIIDLTSRGRDVIVVLPYGGAYGFYSDWADGSQAWETFVIDTLVPSIDARYRTKPDRRFRALTGESMGGIGSLILAGRHPDLFSAAFAFSGGIVLSEGVGAAVQAGSLWFGRCAGATAPSGLWDGEIGIRAHDPAELAVNYRSVSLMSFMGNGVPCDADDVAEIPARVYPAIETPLRIAAERLAGVWREAGISFRADFRDCGTHSFRHISPAVTRHWRALMASFGGPDATDFDHRAVEPSFSVWDWTFAADPARAREFLNVMDASCDGFSLRGSGTTTVTTAPCFTPGASVLVNDVARTADVEGRLTLTGDLGPAHQFEQFTPAARALEAADGDYWTSRTVSLEVHP